MPFMACRRGLSLCIIDDDTGNMVNATHIRRGTFLPHWTKPQGMYAVRFRLADSLPQTKLKRWRDERTDILEQARVNNRPLTEDEHFFLTYLQEEHVQRFLRSGYGACWLRRNDIATIVAAALRARDGTWYRLYAWCIMPNHVHVVVQPLPGHSLSDILHRWKGSTARTANLLLKRQGAFWQKESYDRLVRNAGELQHHMQYTWDNPDKAGLKHWPWRWKMPDGAWKAEAFPCVR